MTYKLINGDSLIEMEFLMSDGEVDLIVTDPPYGMALKPQRVKGKFKGVSIIADDNLAWADQFFIEAYRVLVGDGAMLAFCNHFCISEFITSAKKAGFTIKNTLIWDKGNFGLGGNWRPQHEFILLLSKGRLVTKSKNLGTIIKCPRVNHTKALHPTQKPVELLKQLIYEPDYEPQNVFDPFMGSGSTGVACAELGRNFRGVELDHDFYRIAEKRINEAYQNMLTRV